MGPALISCPYLWRQPLEAGPLRGGGEGWSNQASPSPQLGPALPPS